jgi:GAF domain-containing protein
LLQKLADALRDQRGNDALVTAVRILKEGEPRYTWVGVYLLEGGRLVLGPYLGKPTCHVVIPVEEGICGAAARQGATVIVPDVTADPRYLACSLETRSEIVVPILLNGRVLGEIDIDSDFPDAFGQADRQFLERVAALLAERL